MRRCRSQIRNPTSQISQLGRVFQMSRLSHLSHMSHLSQMLAMFPMFPAFPMFAAFAMFPMFAAFPRTRDARKKTERQKIWNLVSEARASARAQRRFGNAESGPAIGRLKPGLKTRSRFTRFKCFRRFISFMRFKRYRNIWPLQKMKHPDPNIGTRVPDLKCAYFLKSKTILANAFTPTSSRLSSMMKSGVWCGAASFGSLPAGIPPTVK